MHNDIDYKRFGQTIRALRCELNITQQTVCDSIGISCTHYSNIENGLAKPSLDVLVSIANFYNIPLSSALLSNGSYYQVSYDVKAVFEKLDNKDALKILDILSYTQKHLYQ